MFCPSCHDEFRPGFTACPDCMVDLVDALPDENSHGEEVPDRNGDDATNTTDPDGPPRELRLISRPSPGEYAAEAARYIDRIPDDGRVLEHMAENLLETEALALSIGDEAMTRPYGPGKWTGKELLVHVSDDERIYAYRALRFGRGDTTELPGFEEKDYARSSRANERSLEDILRELAAVRGATIELFDGLDYEALLRVGVANGHPMSVRAAAYHIAGHELHHRALLEDGYR